MTVAAILRQVGFVPTVPTAPPAVGTPQTLVASHVPIVPTVPTKNGEGVTAAGAIRARLLALAERQAVDLAHVHRLHDLDVAACAGLDDGEIAGYLDMLRDTADRHAGRVPLDDTAAIHCEGCGPVWIHPDIAAVLPVVDGWPRALGCPWCFVRKAGGHIPRPPVMCESCRHFTPDTINPEAGMGTCASGHGMNYPMTRHACADHAMKGNHDEA